jgi:small ligand-binding sensory domain FIST
MHFVAGVTTEPLLHDALHRLETSLGQKVGDQEVDLSVVFLSAHFRGQAQQVRSGLQEIFHPAELIGCSAESIIGPVDELEQTPAIAVLLACLPGVTLTPFSLASQAWAELLEDEAAFRQAVPNPPAGARLGLLFCDPFSTPVDHVLKAFEHFHPGVPVLGGMASAAMAAGQNTLFLKDRILNNGAVGLLLSGDFDLDYIVSQGSRPVGDPYVVTGARQNVIFSLENQPPLFRIQEMVDHLSEDDHQLLQRGLLIGRAINPIQDVFGRGDFLIRSVLAADHHNGAITVGDVIQSGEIVQFHVRDALTAREDLEMMLIPQAFRPPAAGVLMFTCNGRGTRLFDVPSRDVSIVQKGLGNVPLAGFFCAGEIGPVRGHNFVHGHTVCLAIFRPAQPSEE